MEPFKLLLPPGVQSNLTDYTAGAQWIAGDKVRFKKGLPEKWLGWESETGWDFQGQASNGKIWQTLDGSRCIAVGTEQKLELVYNDVLYDITPLRQTSSLTDPFTVTSGSAIVTVDENNHGAVVDDIVIYSGASAVGGITPDGEYTVKSVPNANQYTFEHSSAATGNATGGGSVTAKYLISTGSATAAAGTGWGASSWNTPRQGSPAVTATVTNITQANPAVVTSASHPFSNGQTVMLTGVVGMIEVNGRYFTVANAGANDFELSGEDSTGHTAYTSGGIATRQYGWNSPSSAAASDIILDPSTWSLDTRGEDLIACRRDGTVYVWDASAGPGTRATAIANAPTRAKMAVVFTTVRNVVALGASFSSADDPLNVAWSDDDDYTIWTAATSNTAGSRRLNRGTKIITGIVGRGGIIIFTNAAIFAMEYIGPTDIYGFRPLGENSGPCSQTAVIEINGKVYWMTKDNFYMYDGVIRTIETGMWAHVFDNKDGNGLNLSAREVVFCGQDEANEEFLFFYPSGSSEYPDRFVAISYTNPSISYGGTLERAVWIDKQSFVEYPVGIDQDGTLYYHAKGEDADGSAMSVELESGALELPTAGGRMILHDKLIPDFVLSGGDMEITFYVRKYPNASETTKGPYTLSSTTEKKSVRVRGRQLRYKISSSASGVSWKWGTPRLQAKGAGKR